MELGQKAKVGLMLIALTSLFAIGYSGAYFFHQSDLKPAIFITTSTKVDFAGRPEIDVVSDYIPNQGVTWAITNKGSNDIYLRVRPGDEVSADNYQCGRGGDVSMRVMSTAWAQGDDGYYYYSDIVGPEQTVDFPLEVQFNGWCRVQYPLEMEAEAVQEPNDARAQMWPQCPYN
jgi:hypothetical protein